MTETDPGNGRPRLDADLPLDARTGIDIDAVVARALEQGQADPILRPAVAAELDALLQQEVPAAGISLERVLAEIEPVAVDYSRRNAHPGFFGYVCSPGLPTDPLTHALVAALNQNVTGFSSAPGATAIERAVIRWLCSLAGLGGDAGGLFVSGGSLANFTAIAVAVLAMRPELRRRGLRNTAARLMLYTSEEAHFSIERAAILLGLGTDGIRKIPVDSSFRIRPADLERQITRDRDAGFEPCCIVGTAGSTTTGSIDSLEAIAEIAARHGLWFHVDAAYGGGALLSEVLRPRLAGLARANSVTVDLHKWFLMAFDGSALLFRDPSHARRVFSIQADYVQFTNEPTPEQFAFLHLGPETSRRFRALPAYVALRHYGVERLGKLVHYQARCAEYLAGIVDRHPDLDLVCVPELSICCFRFAPPSLAGDPARVDLLNREIRLHLAASGRFYLSATNVRARPVLRVCVQSHATRAEHLEELALAVVDEGRCLLR